jgi:hypothetical protein
VDLLDEQIVQQGIRHSFALETLRRKLGDGVFDVELGSIFLDINYYADQLAVLKNPYGVFVATVYFPALLRKLRPWAVRELGRGDELYLVCLKELIQRDCSVPLAVHQTIIEILKFQEEEGAALCAAEGFERLRLQVGASYGMAQVICDLDQVRTEGEIVVEAARLQKAAPVGGVLVSSPLTELWPKTGALAIGPSLTDLKKKTRLSAKSVQLKKKFRDAA